MDGKKGRIITPELLITAGSAPARERAAKIKTRGKGTAPEKGKFLKDATERFSKNVEGAFPRLY